MYSISKMCIFCILLKIYVGNVGVENDAMILIYMKLKNSNITCYDVVHEALDMQIKKAFDF